MYLPTQQFQSFVNTEWMDGRMDGSMDGWFVEFKTIFGQKSLILRQEGSADIPDTFSGRPICNAHKKGN